MRHGESLGNQKRIIQGRTNDYGLSETGKRQIEKVAERISNEFHDINKMIVSPTKRTIQTANIIHDKIGKQIPVEIDNSIIEFNPGILAGHTHEYNAVKYPKYYKIWKQRGDLDGIPGAEKGNNLQARVIAFLMRYIDEENFNDIIVAHAGYNRCLVNTIEGRDRTTPIDSSNGAINVVENPLKNLKIQHKSRAMTSKVYIVETVEDKYVVKMKNRPIQKEDILEKHLLERLRPKFNELPFVSSLTNTQQGSVKVLQFLKGKHIYGKLNEQQKKELMQKIKKMHNALKKMSTEHYKKIDLVQMMKDKAKHSKNKYVINLAQEILLDSRKIRKLNNSRYCLVHSDLNRDNILFDDNENEHKVHIIDWEGIEVLPEDYQLACYLVSSMLIEDGNMSEIMELAHQFKWPIDEDYLVFLMKIRIFDGLYFFAENKNEYIQSNQKVSKEILKKFFIANEKIKIYQKRKRQKRKIECKER